MSDPDPIAKSLAVAATTIQQYKQSPSRQRALFLVQAAQKALDRAKTVAECKDIHDALRLLQVYAGLRREDWRNGQTFAMQRIITERKMGELLREQVAHKGASVPSGNTIPEGISRKDSMNWQRLAELEADELKGLMQAVFETEELSTAWAVRQWQKLHGHISIHDNGDETDHDGPPAPDNFQEDHLYPDFGSRMRGLLNECQDAFAAISHQCGLDAPSLGKIDDVCSQMQQRIIELFEEMK